ncbi:hypothetical protein V6N11_019128 [Hibiscus sabdariffa]|uniref:Uncharacterized protein n=1 Tax=Hibiscus sabdariffa TaxID=183260 RepID=A0ABR2R1E7_9ROSI
MREREKREKVKGDKFCLNFRPPEGRWCTPLPPSRLVHQDESAGGRLTVDGVVVKGCEEFEELDELDRGVSMLKMENRGHYKNQQSENSGVGAHRHQPAIGMPPNATPRSGRASAQAGAHISGAPHHTGSQTQFHVDLPAPDHVLGCTKTPMHRVAPDR